MIYPVTITRVDEGSWTTWNELWFIKNLGSWCIERHVKGGVTREELLERYLQASKRRYHWDDIDRDAVIQEVVKLLREYREGKWIR